MKRHSGRQPCRTWNILSNLFFFPTINHLFSNSQKETQKVPWHLNAAGLPELIFFLILQMIDTTITAITTIMHIFRPVTSEQFVFCCWARHCSANAICPSQCDGLSVLMYCVWSELPFLSHSALIHQTVLHWSCVLCLCVRIWQTSPVFQVGGGNYVISPHPNPIHNPACNSCRCRTQIWILNPWGWGKGPPGPSDWSLSPLQA